LEAGFALGVFGAEAAFGGGGGGSPSENAVAWA
jgi:hypothetical protein